ncbi:MAG: hypothetical protein JKY14_13590 [Paraglaciecola sp.]|nr:hypothetical protein [Paraglaciecola sp.]
MKLLLILTALALPFISNQSNSYEAYIGLKTYHFNRGGRDCLNEEHHLAAVNIDGYMIGTYENSRCERSYLIGSSHDLGYGFGVDMGLVTGYPKPMHIVKGITLIPMVTYARYWGDYGFKAIMVPSVLVGAGLAVKF